MKYRHSWLLIIAALLYSAVAPQTAPAQEAKIRDLFKQTIALAQAGKLAEAEQPLNRLLDETNATGIPTAQVLTFRGFLRAENGRFQDAATDLRRVIDMNPSDHIAWFLLTPLLIQSGQIDEYRSHCKAMLHRFNKTTSPPIAERTAKCCLLLPSAVSPDDLTLAAKVAENAVALAKKGEWMPWRLMTRGLAEYRQGYFARASKTMELAQKELSRAWEAGGDTCQADIHFVSAMAHQQLKQAEEAKADFARGRIIVQIKLPGLDSKDLSPAWLDVLMTYTLMREAKATVEGSAAADRK